MTCSTGRPVAFAIRSMRSRRSQPEWVAGCVETMISDGRRSATASIVARNGSSSPTSPVATMPSEPTAESARSTLTWAESRTTSS